MKQAWIALFAIGFAFLMVSCAASDSDKPGGTGGTGGTGGAMEDDSDFQMEDEPLSVSPEEQEALGRLDQESEEDDELWPSDEELMASLEEEDAANRGSTDLSGVLRGEGAYPKVEGLQMIFFGYDRSDLTAEARRMLDHNVTWLLENPKVRVRVEGHCDERGTSEYNLALGQRRSNHVVEYLIANGIDAERTLAVSFGEEVPLEFGHDSRSWARNRRAEFSYLDGDPSESVGRVLSRSMAN